MSHLQDKSEILRESANILHSRGLYPAVAHSAYYSCYQLMKHIWLYSLCKTENELENRNGNSTRIGSHEFLINQITNFIKNSGRKECLNHYRDFNKKVVRLKSIRRIADYDNTLFDSNKSSESITLSNNIIPILKKY